MSLHGKQDVPSAKFRFCPIPSRSILLDSTWRAVSKMWTLCVKPLLISSYHPFSKPEVTFYALNCLKISLQTRKWHLYSVWLRYVWKCNAIENRKWRNPNFSFVQSRRVLYRKKVFKNTLVYRANSNRFRVISTCLNRKWNYRRLKLPNLFDLDYKKYLYSEWAWYIWKCDVIEIWKWRHLISTSTNPIVLGTVRFEGYESSPYCFLSFELLPIFLTESDPIII